MINFLFGLILFIAAPVNDSSFFEGRIDLVEESQYDTFYYSYFIKDKYIRVDKFDENHKIIQTELINIEKKEIIVLSPSKKLYTRLKSSSDLILKGQNFTIIKTENTRQIKGKECYLWRVRNKELNKEVAYWVAENNYYFFNDFIKLLNHTEKTFEFFEKIPDSQGFFPMLTVERTLLRKEKRRIEVIEIKSQKINDTMFEIPSGFEEVKTNPQF